jgi:hypothetical protein
MNEKFRDHTLLSLQVMDPVPIVSSQITTQKKEKKVENTEKKKKKKKNIEKRIYTSISESGGPLK